MIEQRPCGHLECAIRWAKSGKLPSEFKCTIDETSHYTIQVNLIVKANSKIAAIEFTRDRLTKILNEWYLNNTTPPFPEGSLLMWNVQST